MSTRPRDGGDNSARKAKAIKFDCDLDQIQSLISSQLAQLSSDQIEETYADIHGAYPDVEESLPLVATSLHEMESTIASINEKRAYDLAKSMDPNYVGSSQLRLRFLRGTQFNPREAANMLIRFFEVKLEYFGKQKLVKNIQQRDLNREDTAYLYSGHIQWLPMKDSSGRLVTTMYPGPTARGVNLQSMLRVAAYLRMVAIEDAQIQRRGIVFILSAADIEGGMDLDLPKVKRYATRLIEIHNAMPGSLKALHIVSPESRKSINNYVFAMLCQFMILALDPSEVARVRIKKDGLHRDIQTYLKRFGIAPDLIPTSSNDTTAYNALLTQRKERERLRRLRSGLASRNHLESVCMPSPFDVILGRGRNLMVHQGNRILRNLVEEKMSEYEEASRQDKKDVSSEVVKLIKAKGRFLREQVDGWVEADDGAARLKVSHAFRDLRASASKKIADLEPIDIHDHDGDAGCGNDVEGAVNDYCTQS